MESNQPAKSAIVLSFDRLHLGYLGPYGNDWIETPNLNAFAARSVMFDQCLGDTADPNTLRHAWWTAVQSPASTADANWLTRLREGGVRSELLADVTSQPLENPGFETVQKIRGADGAGIAEAETSIAKLMGAAAKAVNKASHDSQPWLLWIKSRGVPHPWLPPEEFVDLYFDEFRIHPDPDEEPEPEAGSTPAPEQDSAEAEELAEMAEAWSEYHTAPAETPEAPEPPPVSAEELLDAVYARALYASYVSLIDRWLAKLFQVLAKLPEPPLVIITAAAGEQLGEHAELGQYGDGLDSSLLQTPLIVQFSAPDLMDGSRRAALVQAADIGPTLGEWFGIELPSPAASMNAAASVLPVARQETDSLREFLYRESPERRGLRTPEHYFLTSRSEDTVARQESAELYDKPHDRWDLANVAMLSHGLVEELEAKLERIG